MELIDKEAFSGVLQGFRDDNCPIMGCRCRIAGQRVALYDSGVIARATTLSVTSLKFAALGGIVVAYGHLQTYRKPRAHESDRRSVQPGSPHARARGRHREREPAGRAGVDEQAMETERSLECRVSAGELPIASTG
jgi:hypothetical protein